MSILGCDECSMQVDTDYDTDTLHETARDGNLCPECAEHRACYHPLNRELHEDDCGDDADQAAVVADIKEREVTTIDCTPTWQGLMPMYLEVIASQGAFCELRVELMRCAMAADKWNELQKANREAVDLVMS